MDLRGISLLSMVLLLLLSDISSLAAQISGFRNASKFTDESVLKLKTAGASSPFRATVDPSRVKQISWRPRAFLYRGFLTSEECDHLVLLAKDKLEKSTVVDQKTGKSVDSEDRTSSGMFLWKKQDEIVAGIEERIAAWTFFPVENGEDIQILRYELGQKYEPHTDYFEDEWNLKLGGNRVATVLMYLSDVAEGGETVFPYAEVRDNQPKGGSWSDCAEKGYAVKPLKGDALLFFSLHPNATTDYISLHGSCPVIEGEKWSATKWIHVRPFDPDVDDDGCKDKDPSCPDWASSGECKKNPAYMVGTGTHPGHCKKSCKACS